MCPCSTYGRPVLLPLYCFSHCCCLREVREVVQLCKQMLCDAHSGVVESPIWNWCSGRFKTFFSKNCLANYRVCLTTCGVLWDWKYGMYVIQYIHIWGPIYWCFLLVYILYISSAANPRIREFFIRERRGVSQIALPRISEFANGEPANGGGGLQLIIVVKLIYKDSNQLNSYIFLQSH